MSVDLSSYTYNVNDGGYEMLFAVDHVTCGACVARIERGLAGMPGLDSARVNLSDKRMVVRWHDKAFDPALIPEELRSLGFDGRPFLRNGQHGANDNSAAPMVRYLAVAFFGAMNIMLLSISVWSGNVSDISVETRDLFHWVSALIALPVAAYAGQPFYHSAWRALRSGHVNMDVPISLGILLALLLSLYETAQSAHHAYFDSAIMLLFFLLAGRTLDAMMRAKAQTLTANLLALRGETSRKMNSDGSIVEVPVKALIPGDRILVAQGESCGADGCVEAGVSEIDQSLITGETRPFAVNAGTRVYAGSLNLGAALTIRVERSGERDFIEEIEQLRSRAMAVKDKRIVLADRVARYSAPFVHSAAALTFAGWWFATGSIHLAAITAISVLIITCPCALGLAIPAVHVAASSALMRRGILLQEGDALERIAECDRIVFDKTGTLTLPDMDLCNRESIRPDMLAMAQRLALSSRHPVAVAITDGMQGQAPFKDAEEIPGQGVRAVADGREIRLGNPRFTGCEHEAAGALAQMAGATALGFSHGDRSCVFLMAQHLRDDAAKTIGNLNALGLESEIFSGDSETAVAAIARVLPVSRWRGAMTPSEKIAALDRLAEQGHKVLMIGDGINDAPALARAHASVAPAGASQIAQASADALLLGNGLSSLTDLIVKARQARRLMNQNLWFAAGYNALAIPFAVAGLVTPLIAAAAMSLSSIIVSLNAARAAHTRSEPAESGAEEDTQVSRTPRQSPQGIATGADA